MDQANLALIRFLAAEGHPVHVVAHSVSVDCSAIPGVKTHLVTKPFGSVTAGSPLLDLVGRYWARRVSTSGGRVVVNGGNCRFGDINWVHYVHAAAPAPRAANTVAAGYGALRRGAFLRSERRALLEARVIVANSRKTRTDLCAMGLPPERIRVVYCGIDPKRFHPPTPEVRAAARTALGLRPGTRAVAFVGVLGRAKGVDTLLDAWRLLETTKQFDAELLLFGAGERSEWETWIAHHRLERVRLLGFRTDIAALLPGCDALVSPTRYETYGMGVKESLCAGMPAFVTRTAGIAEQYPDSLSPLLLDSPDDPKELATKLQRWLSGEMSIETELRAFGTQLRTYSWSDMARQLVAAVS